jgi:hypothetical protein
MRISYLVLCAWGILGESGTAQIQGGPVPAAGGRLPCGQEYHQESLEWCLLGRWRDCLYCGRDERLLEGPQRGTNYQAGVLKLMHNWHRLSFPLEYGYGTMYFKLPRPIRAVTGIPPLWGHSGSTGSFLYYSDDFDVYMAGTIDQTESRIKPFTLISKALRAIDARKVRLGNR